MEVRGVALLTVCAMLSLGALSLVPGGWSEADPNSDWVQKVTAYCVQRYNMESNDVTLYSLLSMKSAQQQVVAGVNYKIVFIIGQTTCRKNGNMSLTNCPLKTGENVKRLQCESKVNYVPWEENITLQKQTCNPVSEHATQ
ncbi:cystatin-like [Pelobates cultripes]|uniref:Cystatin-like n=1 Tax=Pelobates cultripes TaxID=61616 RepID=A0AAD1WV77_PELCU|nr:cystatin-like [Pelobates cultripes]